MKTKVTIIGGIPLANPSPEVLADNQVMDVIQLTNGKNVANFSSPHPFTFEDGTVLPAKSNEEAQRLKVDFIEHKDPDAIEGYSVDMQLTFELSDAVMEEIDKWERIAGDGHVDVVFCPLPMIKALRAMDYDVKASPFRCIRMMDRVKKTLSIVYQTY